VFLKNLFAFAVITAATLAGSMEALAASQNFACVCWDQDGNYGDGTPFWVKLGTIRVAAEQDSIYPIAQKACVAKFHKLNAMADCQFAE
jgi:hypothetical protein